MYGHVELFFTLCYVDIHHLMEKIKNKSCKRLLYNQSNLIVTFVNLFRSALE
jgi:hypothetical protein